MKEVFVSWQDQLDWMENICGATGVCCYEAIRDEMASGLRSEYGKYASFDYEEIPEEELAKFMEWLEEDDE